MAILIGGIIFAVLFFVYMIWIYVKSCVFQTNILTTDEIELNKVPMKQFFHFYSCIGKEYQKF